ncbi:MAG: YceI family protein [Candidatus Dormibacter sp.]|uniref:YceI family protein n=1 Tax=Candidatus Dormibacter sp. TaxID=2973982 RepID=UPI003D9BA1B8
MSERYQLDPAHTVIGFKAKHLAVTTVRGNFQKFDGWVAGDRSNPASLTGEVTVDIASLTTNNEQRDGHLKSGDFFEAEGHPQAVYRPTRAEQTGADTFKVYGDLTIRGITKGLVLDVTVSDEMDHPFQPGGKIVSIEATGSLNRKDFGLNWDGLAGTIPLASNEIKLEIDSELVRTAQTADAATV